MDCFGRRCLLHFYRNIMNYFLNHKNFLIRLVIVIIIASFIILHTSNPTESTELNISRKCENYRKLGINFNRSSNRDEGISIPYVRHKRMITPNFKKFPESVPMALIFIISQCTEEDRRMLVRIN